MEVTTRSYQRPAERARSGRYSPPPNPTATASDSATLRGFVELTGKYGDELLREMVLAAYEASRSGVVVLVLNGVSPREVDHILDPVVRENGWEVGDLRYRRFGAVDNVLLMEAAGSDFVIVHSSMLAGALLSRGTGYMSVLSGIRFLAGRAAIEKVALRPEGETVVGAAPLPPSLAPSA